MTPTLGKLFLTLAVAATLGPAAAADGAEWVDYTGHKTVQVTVRTEADLTTLLRISPDIWAETLGLRPLVARIPPDRMRDLETSGLDFRVLIDDLGPLTTQHLGAPRGVGPFDDYMTFDQIVAFINGLAAARPDLCEVFSIGTSIEGRDLWVLHITGPPVGPKPAVFYHGLQHCREWITGPVVLYLANHLVNSYDTDPCVAALVDGLDIYLTPVVNPDGYVHTWSSNRMWRKNRRFNMDGTYGVDLNRNWAYGWGGGGSSGTPSSEIYRGLAPFSEPETTALRDFILANPDIRAYMDYHSYTQLILWPFGNACVGGPGGADGATFAMLGANMQSRIQAVHGMFYEPGPACETIYQASGVSVDWVYGDQGRFGFTIELRDTGQYGFLLPPAQILPTCEENLPAIMYLTEWAAHDVNFDFPAGVADRLTAGADTTVSVDIVPQFGLVNGATARMFYRYDPAATFTEVALTPIGGDTYQAVLPATNCTSTPEFYFSVESTAGQVVESPCGGPASPHTALVVGAGSVFYEANMDVDPGWSASGQWAYGQPTGQGGQFGGPDPTGGHTGPNVYGYNLNGDYANNLPETHLTTGPIDCTGQSGVTLSFWRWLGVEQPLWDHAYVRVSDDGVAWTTVWQNTAEVADAAWVYQEFDIAAIADGQPTVYVRWTMGTTDTAWQYCGWNIDDVQLFSFGCMSAKGDYNGDTVIDAADFAAMPACLSGPGGGVLPTCAIFDFQEDGDVDLDDFAAFETVFGAP